MSFQDLAGKKFGKLTVLERAPNHIHPNGKTSTKWKCLCDCDNYTIVFSQQLKNGQTQSCGCLRKERILASKKKYNTYDLTHDYGIGIDSKGREFYFDLDDYDKIKDICWVVNADGRVAGIHNSKQVRLHHFILPEWENCLIDHINRNPSDNRKENLRISNKQLNSINRGANKNNKLGVKGVHQIKNGHYCARITINGKTIHLGTFKTLEEARVKRIEFENQYFGDYAFKENFDDK